ncbi:MAG: hypothetical protein CVU84_10435 [Firmicutes bacterium HGW-Firmicutes-1]|jgi:anti-sigma regulatory factor (Ser/Thr protein kinase)|nr:MAG: hypothetical protein CVU84_10435 [Firmicutes bacterium HGW-Firmicutes-1]
MIVYEKNIESSFQAVHEAVEEILQLLTAQWSLLDKKIVFKINFLLREIMNNAVEHGNKFAPGKKVLCRIIKESPYLILEVTDEGEGIILPNQVFDSEDVDTILRDRNRGYQLLMEMALSVSVSGNQVKVVLDLSQEE